MINGKTYYQVLGVLSTAEDVVIKAAYRSLSLKYHPDVPGGGSSSVERMTEINAAYELLSDKERRKRYDEQLRTTRQHGSAFEASETSEDFSEQNSQLDLAWRIATGFYSDLENIYSGLRRTSLALASTYKIGLIESKAFDKRVELARTLEDTFMRRFFGSDENVLCLAKVLILAGARDAAKLLNEIVLVMGKSVSIDAIYANLKKTYPDLPKIWDRKDLRHEELTRDLQRVAMNDIFLGRLKTRSF